MLAAGIGARLGLGEDFAPKALLNFGGKTLLQRHIEILRFLGVRELVLGVGHQADMILAEVGALGAEDFVRTVTNPVYKQGPITTLWSLREEFDTAEPIIFMDADVLYDYRVMDRLIESEHENCFLMDREVEPGDEPVKLCMQDGRLVDFHKMPTEPHEFYGEWIGFLKLAPDMAQRVPGTTQPYIDRGETHLLYEVAFRDLVLDGSHGAFGVEEVTGLPWIEIDFVDDVKLAQTVILPQLEPLPVETMPISQAQG